MDLEQLTELFQWMTLLNAGILTLSAILVMALKGTVYRLHAKLFGLSESEVAAVSYTYLGLYRALFLVFNLAPWLALSMMR